MVLVDCWYGLGSHDFQVLYSATSEDVSCSGTYFRNAGNIGHHSSNVSFLETLWSRSISGILLLIITQEIFLDNVAFYRYWEKKEVQGMSSTMDWEKIFVPSVPVLEIFLRGTIVYLTLFFLLRFTLKRESGTIGMSDLLVIVLIADAAQNAMANDYHSISDGLLLVAVIIFWSYFLDWFAFRFPNWGKLIHPIPLPLVEDGVLLPQNLRKELITREELMGQIRIQGVEELSQVKKAFMESDGRISVIKHQGETAGQTRRPTV